VVNIHLPVDAIGPFPEIVLNQMVVFFERGLYRGLLAIGLDLYTRAINQGIDRAQVDLPTSQAGLFAVVFYRRQSSRDPSIAPVIRDASAVGERPRVPDYQRSSGERKAAHEKLVRR
jgi:hypothetical protein